MSGVMSDDPLGYRLDVADALGDPELGASGEIGDRAAYRLGLALGRCATFGVSVDTKLTPDQIAAIYREAGRIEARSDPSAD